MWGLTSVPTWLVIRLLLDCGFTYTPQPPARAPLLNAKIPQLHFFIVEKIPWWISKCDYEKPHRAVLYTHVGGLCLEESTCSELIFCVNTTNAWLKSTDFSLAGRKSSTVLVYIPHNAAAKLNGVVPVTSAGIPTEGPVLGSSWKKVKRQPFLFAIP